MRFQLDLSRCEDQGQCVLAAPRLFFVDAAGRQALRTRERDLYVSEDVDEADAEALQDAVDVCPVQAISILQTWATGVQA
jgi:ferredoxin